MDSVSGLLILLDDPFLQLDALKAIHRVCDTNYPEIINHINVLEDLSTSTVTAGSKKNDGVNEISELACSIISHCYYHLKTYNGALLFALRSGRYFDVHGSSEYDLTMISKAIQAFITLKNAEVEKSEAKFQSEEEEYISLGFGGALERKKLDEVITGLFQKCVNSGKFKEALGIALESMDLPKVDQLIRSASGNEDVLAYCIDAAMNLMKSPAFKEQVLLKLIDLFEEQIASNGSTNYLQLFSCLLALNNVGRFAQVLLELITDSNETKNLIALQAAFDLLRVQDGGFTSGVAQTFMNMTEGIADEDDFKLLNKLDMMREILSGDADKQIYISVLKTKAKSDSAVFKKIRDVFGGRGAGSVLRNAALVSYSFMHCGTTINSFLNRQEGKQFIKSSSNWGRFSATAAYGVIYKGNCKKSHAALKSFLPNVDLAAASRGGPFADGGSLFALGLVHQSAGVQSPIEKNTLNYLYTVLKDALEQRAVSANASTNGRSSTSTTEPLIHGACLGIGALALGVGNTLTVHSIPHDAFLNPPASGIVISAEPSSAADVRNLVEVLMEIVETDEAVISESAAYAIGMIMLGQANSVLISKLLLQAQERTAHEKIIRAASVAVAMMLYKAAGSADEASLQFAHAMAENNHEAIIRYGGMFALGLAYIGTSDPVVIKKLLRIAVSDVNNDVRRAAVTNIGFVCIDNPKRVPDVIGLLAESYNPHVRYGAAMALGIAGTNLSEKDASFSTMYETLNKLSDDKVDYVRQGSLISLGMVLAGKNWEIKDSMAAKFFTKAEEIIKNEKLSPMTRMGGVLSMGILEQGGRNSAVELVDSNLSSFRRASKYSSGHGGAGFSVNNLVRGPAVAGTVLFLQYWYWYPLMQMLSLSFTPTMLVGVKFNEDFSTLSLASGMQFECDQNNKDMKKFAYPSKIKVKKEEAKVKIETAVLSMTNKIKAPVKAEAKMESNVEMTDATTTTPATAPGADAEVADITEEERVDMLTNPIRVTKEQQAAIAFTTGADASYQPISADDAHKKGIIVCKSSSQSTAEEVIFVKLPHREVASVEESPDATTTTAALEAGPSTSSARSASAEASSEDLSQ